MTAAAKARAARGSEAPSSERGGLRASCIGALLWTPDGCLLPRPADADARGTAARAYIIIIVAAAVASPTTRVRYKLAASTRRHTHTPFIAIFYPYFYAPFRVSTSPLRVRSTYLHFRPSQLIFKGSQTARNPPHIRENIYITAIDIRRRRADVN